jgi:hypothetical protein
MKFNPLGTVSVYLSMTLQTFLLNLDCFFSILIVYTIGVTPWTENQAVARPVPTQNNIKTEYMHTDIHTLSGIRTHDPSVRASERRQIMP